MIATRTIILISANLFSLRSSFISLLYQINVTFLVKAVYGFENTESGVFIGYSALEIDIVWCSDGRICAEFNG